RFGQAKKARQTGAIVRVLFRAALMQVLPADPLHDQPGLAVVGGATVEYARDVGVVEPGEQLALDGQPRSQAPIPAQANDLDRRSHLKGAVGALCAVHLPHAATADQFDHAPGAELGSRLEAITGAVD